MAELEISEKMYKVNEIFVNIDGEGSRSGYPSIFIRLFGCNLDCSYCDSVYACKGDDFTLMSALDISQKCCEFGISNITMTGGEPLMDTDVLFLVAILSSMNFKINIETNGSIDFEPYLSIDNVMITMDYKTMSSGYDSEMIEELIELLRPQDNLKFVVGTTEDLMQMCSALNAFPTKSEVFVSPIFEKIDPKDIVKFLIANKIENIRLQLQAHKIIWAPDMRGV